MSDSSWFLRSFVIEGDQHSHNMTVSETPDKKHVVIEINGQITMLRKDKWDALNQTIRWHLEVEEYGLPETISAVEVATNANV